MNRVICVPAVIAFDFNLLILPSSSCSSVQSEDRADETRSEDVREPSEEARSEPQGSLVPIAHLTSNREDVSTEELSQTRHLAVPQEFQEAAGDLLDRSDFEGFDSAGEVVDHVSRTPESVGLVPWEEIEPRVK